MSKVAPRAGRIRIVTSTPESLTNALEELSDLGIITESSIRRRVLGKLHVAYAYLSQEFDAKQEGESDALSR